MSGNKYKITVVGAGYVGLSISVLLSNKHSVTIVDIDEKKISMINKKESPIKDDEISQQLQSKNISLLATKDSNNAYKNADFIIIATPTNYDERTNQFDTRSIYKVLDDIFLVNKNALIVIKSTIPIGFTNSLRKQYKTEKIIFSPEFLREGYALHDNKNPSRIIIGSEKSEKSKKFLQILEEATTNKEYETFFMSPEDAEAVKLFSNTYLAMRIAFFNELDTFAIKKELNTENIINGMCADSRIGSKYNNPSFGYGGYCLPKDTKQLLSNYEKIPQNIIEAIVKSNATRKNFISKMIIDMKIDNVGIYRLNMKHNSDNLRQSAILEIIDRLVNQKINVLVYEPLIDSSFSSKFQLIDCVDEFKDLSNIIVTNRLNDDLLDVKDKIFSRDIFNTDR